MRPIEFIVETLAHAVRRSAGPPPGIPAHVGSDFERELSSLCEWHSVSPIVASSLDKLALGPGISRITHERLRALSRASATSNEALFDDAAGFRLALSGEGIDALVCGESLFPLTLYDPGYLRPIEKVDFLVRESDWRKVIDVARGAGFERVPEEPSLEVPEDALVYYQYYSPCVFRSGGGNVIQLRFRLFDIGRPDDEEMSWHHARDTSWAGGQFRAVSAEDQLIQASITYNMTRFGRLMNAVDIGLLLSGAGERLDWSYITERLAAKSLYPSFYFTIERVVDLFELPGIMSNISDPGMFRRRRWEILWRPGKMVEDKRRLSHSRRFRFYLFEAGSWFDKIRFIGRVFSPRREWVAAFYGKPYRPWLKIKFIILTLRSRLASS